ncbi:MAG: leucine--tRNA ligase, partial [Tenericutes bacterium]|nr:leucine--tRNA ligase [Mycoplasmatota bacterium]
YELGNPICESSWPSYDESKMIDEEKEIAVQVNGKVRATILVHINDTDDIIQEKALNEDNVKKHIDGKEIVKVIVIKGRIVNIVVR